VIRAAVKLLYFTLDRCLGRDTGWRGPVYFLGPKAALLRCSSNDSSGYSGHPEHLATVLLGILSQLTCLSSSKSMAQRIHSNQRAASAPVFLDHSRILRRIASL